MDADAWDERYAAEPTLWGAELNPVIAPVLGGLTAGTAVDLACGSGRHATWLAEHGWRSTGVDFSPVAIDQARTRSAQVQWEVGDALTWRPAAPLDLVLLAYLHLPPEDMDQVLRRCLSWLSPGGTLVHVGHARINIAHGVGGPQDPSLLPTVAAVAAAVDGDGDGDGDGDVDGDGDGDGQGDVFVRRLEHVERATADGTAIDLLLVAQRLTGE